MRFGYTYQDREGRVHEEEIGAPSKAEAYAALRQHGVRPMKVWELEEPSTATRKPRLAVPVAVGIVAACALAATVALLVRSPSQPDAPAATVAEPSPASPPQVRHPMRKIESDVVELRLGERVARPRPRRQLDLAGIDPAKVFAHPAEVLFANFAQPGADVPPVKMSEELQDDFYDSIEEDIVILPDDPKPVADLKRVVAGIKQEAAARLAGGDTFEALVAWLRERQRMEAEYRAAILVGPGAPAHKNAKLRAMGLAETDSAPK